MATTNTCEPSLLLTLWSWNAPGSIALEDSNKQTWGLSPRTSCSSILPTHTLHHQEVWEEVEGGGCFVGLWRKVHAWSSELSALTFAYTKCNGIIGHWIQTNPISCRQSSVFLFFFFLKPRQQDLVCQPRSPVWHSSCHFK